MVLHNQKIHASDMLRKWLRIEEGGLRQKAQIAWLHEGDSNIHFFHCVVKERCKKNRIDALVDNCRDFMIDPEAIRTSITQFYQNLLGKAIDSLKGIDLQAMLIGPQHTMSQAQDLIKPISKADIDNALKDIDESKSSGLDGFSSHFFKAAWDIIKEDVYALILLFFNDGAMYSPINITSITLVSKSANASKPKDFRPLLCA